ncbi:MAG: hypothetical protein HC883_04345 [Bdellovibrionaceae bacterium]|nr:hypothetical protein [Pseudobdellovibrionaceae bacterium]
MRRKSIAAKGFRGAVFYEILGWLQSGSSKREAKVLKLADSIAPADLFQFQYPIPDSFVAPDYIDAAKWVLINEMTPEFLGSICRNPARRIQALALLQAHAKAAIRLDDPMALWKLSSLFLKAGLTPSDLKMSYVDVLISRNRIERALDLIYQDLGQIQTPVISRAAHRIFSAIPFCDRPSVMVNSLDYGIAPIPGRGFW